MTNAIGIDFGTTKTMVSYFNPATGRVELVRLGRDRDSMPTTVHVDEAGAWTFGEDADDQIELDLEGYCRAFKLHLGERDPILPRAGETAEALAARFLRHIREECERNVFRGESVSAATITIPVSFSPARNTALKRAAEAAGFTSVAFLPEPEAAGTAFLRDNPADEFSRALVLDWGGGTLDIAIISRDSNGAIHADSHCTEGRDDIGGEEMDRMLLVTGNEYWIATFGSSLIESEEKEPELLRKAEDVKIGLSRKETVTFRRGTRKVDVTRGQFRQLIAGQLESAVELAKSALAKNKKQGQPAPDAIILIGGTSQIPAVREVMEANFPNLRVLSWHHSHEAVALGATEMATNAKPQKNKQSSRKNTNRDSKTTPKKQTRRDVCKTTRSEPKAYSDKGMRKGKAKTPKPKNKSKSPDKDTNGNSSTSSPKSNGHFDVICPYCGSIEDVTDNGRWICDTCGKLFDVDFLSLPKKSQKKNGDKPPINLSVRSGLIGGYVLNVRNVSQKRLSLHIESMHWPDEDIKADITLEGAAEMELGWMEVNAARNFRPGETGTISCSKYAWNMHFSISSSGSLKVSYAPRK